jgi:hypothetical protein
MSVMQRFDARFRADRPRKSCPSKAKATSRRDATAAYKLTDPSGDSIAAALSDLASHGAMLALLHPTYDLDVRAAAAGALRLSLRARAGGRGATQPALPLLVAEVRPARVLSKRWARALQAVFGDCASGRGATPALPLLVAKVRPARVSSQGLVNCLPRSTRRLRAAELRLSLHHEGRRVRHAWGASMIIVQLRRARVSFTLVVGGLLLPRPGPSCQA